MKHRAVLRWMIRAVVSLGLVIAGVTVLAQTPGITIQPLTPTSNDPLVITVAGTWQTGCVPRNPQVTIQGGQIQIGLSTPSGSCILLVTPWSQTVTIDRQPPGRYRVDVSINGAAASSTEFTVVKPTIPIYKIQDPFDPQNPYFAPDPSALSRIESKAYGINEFGVVVGVADTSDGRYRAFRWRDDAYTDIFPKDLGPSGAYSSGRAINTPGRAVGWVETLQLVSFYYVRRDRAFWGTERSGMTDGGTLGGSQSQAFGINTEGRVVGGSYTGGNSRWRAFRTAPNSAINAATDDLGTLGGAWSEALGINDAGEVVGGADTPQNLWHAFLWRDANRNGRSDSGEMQDLGTLGGSASEARAINASGQVVGMAQTASGTHAFRTASYSRINRASDDLGTLGGGNSEAFGINSQGYVVGTAQTKSGEYHAFIYIDGFGMIDLNDRVDPSPDEKPEERWILVEARAINRAGQIAGWGTVKGKRRAFLLTPAGAQLPTPTLDVDVPGFVAPALYNFQIPTPKVEVPRDRLAVFRPSDRQWLIRNYDGSLTAAQFGSGDPAQWRLISADYLQTGYTQIAVIKTDTQQWFIRRDDGGVEGPIPCEWVPGSIAVPGDYQGLGRAQLAIYRPNGEWRVRQDNGNWLTVAPFAGTAEPTDEPVPADYLGDGRVEMAIFRKRTGDWFLREYTGTVHGPIRFGRPNDLPVPGNYHYKGPGGGKAQLAVFEPDTQHWRIGLMDGTTLDRVQLGRPGDMPAPGAYSGSTFDGKYLNDLAVFRPNSKEWIYLKPRAWWFGKSGESSAIRVQWGGSGDLHAPASYRFKLGG